jgi:hypothetical protein
MAALWQALGAPPVGADVCQRRARRCSTPPPPAAKAAQSARRIAAAHRLAAGEHVVVPIAYHLIYGSYVAWPGEETDDLAHTPALELTERQTQTLNRAFRGTAFSFVTEEATSSDFARWSAGARQPGEGPENNELAAMIHELTGERSDVLHVFLLRRGWNLAAEPEGKSLFEDEPGADGILMDSDYLPYVDALRPIEDRRLRRYYSEGDTLVHLVGHYFGLLHTFEEPGDDCLEKCGRTSDFVHDTPSHRWPWDDDGKCMQLDTCPRLPGLDPMTNYMNLEPDLCASEFTPGQVERMERIVRLFRANFVVPAAAGSH